MRLTITILLAAAFIVALSPPANAWNNRGHMLVACLAYRQLAPAQKQRIAAVLKGHPHYALLKEQLPANVAIDEWVFIRAATWPDIVRDGAFEADFHRQKWHYINLPFIPPAEAAHVPGPAFEPPTPNVLSAIDECRDVISEKYSSAQRRAASLAWIEHLYGDIHQPLHCSALVTRDHPRGDAGGNKLAVRDGEHVVTLHAYWDHTLGDSTDYDSLVELAKSIEGDPANASMEVATQLSKTKSMEWAEDGLRVAIKSAYLDGELKFGDYDAYKHHQVRKEDIPKLDDNYRSKAVSIARTRVFLGGNRLANAINLLFPAEDQ